MEPSFRMDSHSKSRIACPVSPTTLAGARHRVGSCARLGLRYPSRTFPWSSTSGGLMWTGGRPGLRKRSPTLPPSAMTATGDFVILLGPGVLMDCLHLSRPTPQPIWDFDLALMMATAFATLAAEDKCGSNAVDSGKPPVFHFASGIGA
jgi:hypothetical protein